ncbi:DUF4139 domain-containing protein [Geothrix sp. PMB-07]|uniref:DUF4139 domain-containing protein n=1 Tax=Geothrix sp. PMB-07 TaxID=3068640 RepID=UPI002741F71E|nr:DUF4139 domain-containing protein [Geothrix sp. PMB-07]WLT32876.1 DUF4139 domain-containing protein [Geothrix sp. PMB-07]
MRPTLLLAALPSLLVAQESSTTLKDQKALAVTIYNDNLALVKDTREVRLPKGEARLAFQEVSANIRPETALLRSLTAPKDFWVAEQNFDFDLLTPQKLLEKYVGEKVTVVRSVPNADGAGSKEVREEATVLATNNGTVLQFADRIETSIPGRLVFPKVPGNLRARPTLVISLNSGVEKPQQLELSYLTGGLSWRADYVANLSSDEKTLDLSGWVTLTNQSGAAYPNATLQLVAGDVNRARDQRTESVAYLAAGAVAKAAPAPKMAEESLFEYHLYTLDRPTTLAVNQTKQVALLSAGSVPVRKEYLLQGQNYYYSGSYGDLGEKQKVGVFVEFDNKESSRLGMPLPKGIIRVYKRDSEGRAQFVGEDNVDHTPKNELVRLKLGDAFDVTAKRKQTDYKSLGRQGKYGYVHESAFEVELKNAKKEPVTVNLLEPLPGDWEMLQSSQPHTKEAAGTARFKVTIPAEGSATLTYRVRVKW